MRIKTVISKRTTATIGLMTLLWLLSTLTTPSLSHTAVFFDTDFETCPTGTSNDFPCEGWNDFDQALPSHLEASTAFAFSGSKSVKGTGITSMAAHRCRRSFMTFRDRHISLLGLPFV